MEPGVADVLPTRETIYILRYIGRLHKKHPLLLICFKKSQKVLHVLLGKSLGPHLLTHIPKRWVHHQEIALRLLGLHKEFPEIHAA